MKLSLAAALVATLGTTATLADDQQLQNRLALQRAQDGGGRMTANTNMFTKKGVLPPGYWRQQESGTTIAVYGNRRGLGGTKDQRLEARSNAHGQHSVVAVPAR